MVAAVLTVVAGLPRPQNPDSELIVGNPVLPPDFPFFLSSPGMGSVVGEVVVSSAKVAVKRSKK